MRHIYILTGAAVLLAAAGAHGAISIRTDYPGGNVKIDKIDEAAGIVAVRPDLRDTQGNWFHWDFTLSGAAGRRIHFQFPKGYDYLSSLGPAISRDGGKSWRWLNNDGRRHEPVNAFDYTFAPNENETRFAVSIPYSQKDWDAAFARWRGKGGVSRGVLCKSQSGRRDTELLRVPCRRRGAAKWLCVFTARHHACETTGSYAMEGVIDELLSGSPDAEWMRDNADCVFVPFMDKDGVEDGDQGKNRRPHDHNRDYIQGVYTSVRALKNLLVAESNGRQIVFFDLHSPHVRSFKHCPEQDHAFTFNTFVPEKDKRIMEFRRNWAEAQKGGALVYDGAFDIVKSAAENKKKHYGDIAKGLSTSRGWVEELPNCFVSICCEFGYSLCGGVFTPDGGRGLGRSLLKAASRTMREPAAHAAPPPPKPAKDALSRPLRVAVYCGDGAFGGGAMRWLQMPLYMDNAVPVPVDGAAIRAGALAGADVLVMPGGSAHLQARELGPEGRKKIEAFIRGGGGYIGTCAGCYLCIHPHNQYPYMGLAPYRSVAKGDPGEMLSRRIEFCERAKELCGIAPGACGVFYHGGPVMEAVKRVPPDDVRFEPIAFYGANEKPAAGTDVTAQDAGKVAIAVGSVGKGRVFACALHPESVFNDKTPILKGAFKYVTGRDVAIKLPDVFAPGVPKAMFVTYDGFGVGGAKTILVLARHREFSVIPLAVSKIAGTSLDGVSVVMFPDGIGSENRDRDAIKYIDANSAKLRDFVARGGKILAWGRGAAHLEKSAIPFDRAKNGDEAVEMLAKRLAKPAKAASPLAAVKALAPRLKPLRTWALPYAAGVPAEAFVSRHEPPRAAPTAAPQPWTAMDADDFFPFIDKYGQFLHKDWPDKIHSDADFAVQREKEAKDLAAHPGPQGWDKWGGWADGPQLEKRGGFYTTKWEGKWWIVDPEGHLWWSHGPVRVLPSSAMTPLAVPGANRAGWFAELPARDDPVFGAFYETRDALLWPYYGKRGIDKVYDFSAANIRRKYGENWFETWADLAHRRLRSWSCNTIANSSDKRICMMDRTPYTERFEIHARPIAGHKGGWWEFCDPFDPSFRAEARRMTELYRAEIDDPWCVGFFVDNEHYWGEKHALALSTLKSPAGQLCKAVFRDRLREKYGEIEKLNKAWNSSYAGWDAFLADTKPPKSLAGALPDLEAFSSEIAETYFRVIREELKRANPCKMYLGCRWAQTAPEFVVRAAAKYCDVVSYNIYAKNLRSFKLPDGVDMPVLIGEFHFGALDRGPFCPGLILLKDQQERAATYKDYVRSALESPWCVGVHWHQFSDQATSGRFDGENMQVGWTDVCDTPYWETVEAVREIGAKMYEIRARGAVSDK